MTTFYPYPYYRGPVPFTGRSPIVPVNPLYTVPTPLLVNPTPMLPTPICPYCFPVAPAVMLPGTTSSAISPMSSYQEPVSEFDRSDSDNGWMIEMDDPIDYYLLLPKYMFPSANMLNMDPNTMIDEFCKLPNIDDHVDWILDLEFGTPKSPVPRPIPYYDFVRNNVYCMNTAYVIHPGFESCSEDFKRAFQFYYDYVVSVWYHSYVYLNHDKSMINFQTWIMLPMQELGMNWA